jgi:hypothetical protein
MKVAPPHSRDGAVKSVDDASDCIPRTPDARVADGGLERVVAQRAPPAVLLFRRGRRTAQSPDGAAATDELAAFRRRRAPRLPDVDAVGAAELGGRALVAHFVKLDRSRDGRALRSRQPGVRQAAAGDGGVGVGISGAGVGT